MARLALGAALVGGLLVACGGGDDDARVEGEVTATPPTIASTATVAPPTAAPTKPAPTQVAPTQPPATEPPPAPTADTRVPIQDLPRLSQIQLGEDGKYFVADRGDGCVWVEVFRGEFTLEGEEIFQITLDTDCPADFNYAYWPEMDEVRLQVE